jgi:Protein of unknown function (DUF4240)
MATRRSSARRTRIVRRHAACLSRMCFDDLVGPITVSAMPADQFWQIIWRAARSDHDPDAHLEALRVALRELSREEVISFAAAFSRYRREAYSWDLWGGAYVVNGGCSDDGFEYFCCWLVSRGREVYESALADSDGLAQLVVRPGANGPWEFEGINSTGIKAIKSQPCGINGISAAWTSSAETLSKRTAKTLARVSYAVKVSLIARYFTHEWLRHKPFSLIDFGDLKPPSLVKVSTSIFCLRSRTSDAQVFSLRTWLVNAKGDERSIRPSLKIEVAGLEVLGHERATSYSRGDNPGLPLLPIREPFHPLAVSRRFWGST